MSSTTMATTSLRVHALLGHGRFSSIFLAQRNDDPDLLVLKCHNRVDIVADPDAVLHVIREKWAMETIARLPHPFVVQHRCSHVDGDFVFYAMENVGGGDMYSMLQLRGGHLPPADVRFYAGELALALGHVHSFDVMHRDVKVRSLPAPM